ncbi:MAG TPA: serine/threonine-protein kinase [Kofleriaceae bacterium]|nr:serine/threonine-protein kinase [Kofleriaceae bacterium]
MMGVAAAATRHVFGKYSLVAKLATGGMAEIFLARLQGAAGFEKLVCIKRILPHLAKDQQLVEMFLAEARIAAQISHPNVCQVFELGEIEGRYFIAMEYLEGVPFSCFRRRDLYPGHPDPRLIAGLGAQACEGLHHAHQLKRPDGSPLEVVHRDVSSNNLFATVDGVVKVLDFGIAKVQDASVRTTTGSVKGTYAYMSPEQLRGERVDRRTDVFAMGIVLWELFARRHLFRRETDFLTFQAITSEPIPEVAELRPDVPPELSQTIARALSRDREERYPTARALGEALAQSVQSIGGPWSAAMIADELARAFEVRMRDQQVLIRVAREGGVLDLDDDLGPAVGHGTALVTTPVSMLTGRGAAAPPTEIERPVLAQGWATANSQPPPPRPRVSAAMRAVQLEPPAQVRSRLPMVLLTLLTLGALGAAGFFYLQWRVKEEVAAKTAPGPTIAMPVTAIDAASAQPSPSAGDAAVAVAVAPVEPTPTPTPKAPDEASPPPPTPTTPTTTPVTPTRPDTRPPRPSLKKDPVTKDPEKDAAKPSGPPGFITIDSTPMYSIIFIDSKRYGETPLVRLALPPGKHSLRAVSPSGTSRTMTITIEPGKVAPTRRIEW